MRIPRIHLLWPESSTVHLYWRCHNRDFHLSDLSVKELYLRCVRAALQYNSYFKNCKIHSFCVMGNHFHQTIAYTGGSSNLSRFMHYAHSLFGARFNRLRNRTGSVGEGRPKTPLIENPTHEMRVHFYVEANPIRAKMRTLDNLKDYIYSSYGFYAFGLRTEFSDLLTIPDWYMNLGRSVKERQKNYRKLFKNYVATQTSSVSKEFKQRAIGSPVWIQEFTSLMRSITAVSGRQQHSALVQKMAIDTT